MGCYHKIRLQRPIYFCCRGKFAGSMQLCPDIPSHGAAIRANSAGGRPFALSPVLFAGLRHSHAFYPTVCTGRMIRIAAGIGASGRKGGGRTVPDVAERSGPAAQGGIKEGRGIDLPERSCGRQQGSDPRRRSQGGVSRECWRQGSGISAADSPHGPQVFFFRQRRR